MSWDIWLETEVDGHKITLPGTSFNYTHNCNRMIRSAGFTEWPYSVDGWNAEELEPRLYAATVIMAADPETYRAMNPENGWGDYDSLMDQLGHVMDVCQKFPSATVRMFA